MQTCWQAIQAVFADNPGVLTTAEVNTRVYELFPDKPWQKSTIYAHLFGMSVNHPSSRHYPHSRKHAMLFSLGNGRYRVWDPDQDGYWEITDSGVQLVGAGEDEVVVEDESEIVDTAVSVTLSLERDLETAILGDLQKIEPGLTLYRKGEVTGHQFNVQEAGRIDILAIDTTETPVVIELKAGKAAEKAIAQLLRYMGWLVEDDQFDSDVRGILIASAFDDKCRYAAIGADKIKLMRYQARFDFEEVS